MTVTVAWMALVRLGIARKIKEEGKRGVQSIEFASLFSRRAENIQFMAGNRNSVCGKKL